MVAIKSDTPQTKTRQQLLEAAGQVFAEHGYRAATVREICLRAGANIASIHYHFGDKEKLYIEVLRYAHKRGAEINADLSDESRPAEERLKNFIRSFLSQLLEHGSLTWDAKLIAREMIEPSAVFDVVIEERIRPLWKKLNSITKAIIGPGATDDEVRDGGLSIVGQIVYYRHCREVINRLEPKWKLSDGELDKLSESIATFSIAGLKAIAQQRK
jgi:TetR/AcrR family transcriptional regulator, regulator of cefoperazone and chloramphenicol sensitivity